MREQTEHGDRRQVLVVGDDPVGAAIARNLSGDVTFLGLDDGIARRVTDEVRDAETVCATTDLGETLANQYTRLIE